MQEGLVWIQSQRYKSVIVGRIRQLARGMVCYDTGF